MLNVIKIAYCVSNYIWSFLRVFPREYSETRECYAESQSERAVQFNSCDQVQKTELAPGRCWTVMQSQRPWWQYGEMFRWPFISVLVEAKGFCINQPLDVPNHRRGGVISARQLSSGESSAWEGTWLCAFRCHHSWQLKELLPLSWRVLCVRQHIIHDKSNINSNKITGACTWLSPMETVTS